MAKKRSYGARHMAWVRSFKKNRSRHRKHHRKHNPYPMAGTVAALANYRRRHRKHNPGGVSSFARGTLGLPPLMPVVYGGGGFIATAAVQGFVDTLVPASVGSAATSPMIKYAEIAASIVIVSWLSKKFIGGGASAFAAVGGGIYALQQAVHDFLPGTIPGMHAYTPLKAYTPVRRSSSMGTGVVIDAARGGFPSLAQPRFQGMPQLAKLAAPAQGFRNSADFAGDGGMQIVAERFRRL